MGEDEISGGQKCSSCRRCACVSTEAAAAEEEGLGMGLACRKRGGEEQGISGREGKEI